MAAISSANTKVAFWLSANRKAAIMPVYEFDYS